jgi:RNA polymerase sigma factor (sigma-70 family)
MDEERLRAELERHHHESFGWALVCSRRDTARAESVLQESYLKVLDGRASYDGRSSFKTWLFSVIRKTGAELWRREVLLGMRFGGVSRPIREPSVAGHAFDSVYRSEVQAIFEKALSRLPRRQREILHLVFYHDFSITEAAEVMSLSIGSARTHYERAKKRLRASIVESGAFDEARSGRAENQTTVQATEGS